MTYAIGDDATLGIACLGHHPSAHLRPREGVPAHAEREGARRLRRQPAPRPLRRGHGDREAARKEEILADPDVHAVLIHPKSYLMADWAIEAMEAGKAVLCEKPAGRGSVDTVRLVETAERTGQLFQVGYCWRYAPSVDKMQEVLKAGPARQGAAGARARRLLARRGRHRSHAPARRHRRRLLRHRLPHHRPPAAALRDAAIGQRPDHQVRRRDGARRPRGRRRRDPELRRQDDHHRLHVVGSAALDRGLGHHRLRHRRRDAFPSAARLLQALQHRQDRPSRKAGPNGTRRASPRSGRFGRRSTRPRSPRSATRSTSTARPRPSRTPLRTGAPSNVPAQQAHNINLILEALFASSSQGGAEVPL